MKIAGLVAHESSNLSPSSKKKGNIMSDISSLQLFLICFLMVVSPGVVTGIVGVIEFKEKKFLIAPILFVIALVTLFLIS